MLYSCLCYIAYMLYSRLCYIAYMLYSTRQGVICIRCYIASYMATTKVPDGITWISLGRDLWDVPGYPDFSLKIVGMCFRLKVILGYPSKIKIHLWDKSIFGFRKSYVKNILE